MPAKNEVSQAIRVRLACDATFPLDLIVRTPENLSKRLAWDDWFLRDIVEQGIVLHQALKRH
jgi:hypothetical protein